MDDDIDNLFSRLSVQKSKSHKRDAITSSNKSTSKKSTNNNATNSSSNATDSGTAAAADDDEFDDMYSIQRMDRKSRLLSKQQSGSKVFNTSGSININTASNTQKRGKIKSTTLKPSTTSSNNSVNNSVNNSHDTENTAPTYSRALGSSNKNVNVLVPTTTTDSEVNRSDDDIFSSLIKKPSSSLPSKTPNTTASASLSTSKPVLNTSTAAPTTTITQPSISTVTAPTVAAATSFPSSSSSLSVLLSSAAAATSDKYEFAHEDEPQHQDKSGKSSALSTPTKASKPHTAGGEHELKANTLSPIKISKDLLHPTTTTATGNSVNVTPKKLVHFDRDAHTRVMSENKDLNLNSGSTSPPTSTLNSVSTSHLPTSTSDQHSHPQQQQQHNVVKREKEKDIWGVLHNPLSDIDDHAAVKTVSVVTSAAPASTSVATANPTQHRKRRTLTSVTSIPLLTLPLTSSVAEPVGTISPSPSASTSSNKVSQQATTVPTHQPLSTVSPSPPPSTLSRNTAATTTTRKPADPHNQLSRQNNKLSEWFQGMVHTYMNEEEHDDRDDVSTTQHTTSTATTNNHTSSSTPAALPKTPQPIPTIEISSNSDNHASAPLPSTHTNTHLHPQASASTNTASISQPLPTYTLPSLPSIPMISSTTAPPTVKNIQSPAPNDTLTDSTTLNEADSVDHPMFRQYKHLIQSQHHEILQLQNTVHQRIQQAITTEQQQKQQELQYLTDLHRMTIDTLQQQYTHQLALQEKQYQSEIQAIKQQYTDTHLLHTLQQQLHLSTSNIQSLYDAIQQQSSNVHTMISEEQQLRNELLHSKHSSMKHDIQKYEKLSAEYDKLIDECQHEKQGIEKEKIQFYDVQRVQQQQYTILQQNLENEKTALQQEKHSFHRQYDEWLHQYTSECEELNKRQKNMDSREQQYNVEKHQFDRERYEWQCHVEQEKLQVEQEKQLIIQQKHELQHLENTLKQQQLEYHTVLQSLQERLHHVNTLSQSLQYEQQCIQEIRVKNEDDKQHTLRVYNDAQQLYQQNQMILERIQQERQKLRDEQHTLYTTNQQLYTQREHMLQDLRYTETIKTYRQQQQQRSRNPTTVVQSSTLPPPLHHKQSSAVPNGAISSKESVNENMTRTIPPHPISPLKTLNYGGAPHHDNTTPSNYPTYIHTQTHTRTFSLSNVRALLSEITASATSRMAEMKLMNLAIPDINDQRNDNMRDNSSSTPYAHSSSGSSMHPYAGYAGRNIPETVRRDSLVHEYDEERRGRRHSNSHSNNDSKSFSESLAIDSMMDNSMLHTHGGGHDDRNVDSNNGIHSVDNSIHHYETNHNTHNINDKHHTYNDSQLLSYTYSQSSSQLITSTSLSITSSPSPLHAPRGHSDMGVENSEGSDGLASEENRSHRLDLGGAEDGRSGMSLNLQQVDEKKHHDEPDVYVYNNINGADQYETARENIKAAHDKLHEHFENNRGAELIRANDSEPDGDGEDSLPAFEDLSHITSVSVSG